MNAKELIGDLVCRIQKAISNDFDDFRRKHYAMGI